MIAKAVYRNSEINDDATIISQNKYDNNIIGIFSGRDDTEIKLYTNGPKLKPFN